MLYVVCCRCLQRMFSEACLALQHGGVVLHGFPLPRWEWYISHTSVVHSLVIIIL
jgi:hypothetical protein